MLVFTAWRQRRQARKEAERSQRRPSTRASTTRSDADDESVGGDGADFPFAAVYGMGALSIEEDPDADPNLPKPAEAPNLPEPAPGPDFPNRHADPLYTPPTYEAPVSHGACSGREVSPSHHSDYGSSSCGSEYGSSGGSSDFSGGGSI